jgi:ATP-binding cassette, subfamily C (CFTR/MRP), member 1
MVMTLFGTIALVFYTIPLLGLIFAPLGLFYHVQTTYYRRSMMEARRLDSLLRSGLYTTITGESSIGSKFLQSLTLTQKP